MAETVYVLCALASCACGVLLFRGYKRSRARLLLWSSMCFVGLTLNNVLLFLDKVVFPDVDLSPWRTITALGGLLVLVFGLIWESE